MSDCRQLPGLSDRDLRVIGSPDNCVHLDGIGCIPDLHVGGCTALTALCGIPAKEG